MTSPPLDSTRSRQRRVWHDITVVGQHTRSDDVECDMTSPPLDSTHGQTTSGVACHHRLWTAYTVECRRMWHAIIAFGQHTGSNDSGVACHHRFWAAKTVERRLTWHAIIAVGLAHTVGRCQAWHAIIALGRKMQSNNVRHGMPSSPLGSTHGRTSSAVACHHRLWAAQTVKQHRGSMPSPPLDYTDGRTTSGVS